MFNWMLRKSTRKRPDGEETTRRQGQNLEEIKARRLCHLSGTAEEQPPENTIGIVAVVIVVVVVVVIFVVVIVAVVVIVVVVNLSFVPCATELSLCKRCYIDL